MGLEQRGNKSYFYYKLRSGDQVHSFYINRGRLRRLLEYKLDLNAARRAQTRALRQEAEGIAHGFGDLLKDLDELASAVAQAELLAEGYYLHRGCWRRSPWLTKVLDEEPSAEPTGTEHIHEQKG